MQREIDDLQAKRLQDSNFYKLETTRKDQDLLKVKSFFESKINEKDAEFAMKIEEIRVELVGVLSSLVSNQISLDCCETLDKLIQTLT